MRRRALALGIAAALMLAPAARAQEAAGAAPGGVLVIDQERLFEESRFGGEINARVETAARELAAENRRIEAELAAEERDLTARRPGLPVEEFRALADAFDARVQEIRAAQDDKGQAIQRLQETGRQELFLRLAPVLSAIVRERGAAVLLDRRSVVLSADAIDITDEAIARLDATLEDPQPATPQQ